MRFPSLLLAFALGVAAATALSSLAGAPPSIAPIPTRPVVLRPVAHVLPVAGTELRVAPNGKASVRVLARGQNAFMGILRMNANGAVKQHRDASEEFIYVLSGKGRITIDGKPFAVEPNSIIYMPANAEVSYDNGPEELVAVQVFANPDSAAKYDSWKRPPRAERTRRPSKMRD